MSLEIQQLFLDELLKHGEQLSRKAVVTIDGVERDFSFFRSEIIGNRLQKMVYIENETGTISRAILVDSQGRNLHVKDMDIIKGPHGFMIVFRVDIKIEGA